MSLAPLLSPARRSFVARRQLGFTTTLTDNGALDEAAPARTPLKANPTVAANRNRERERISSFTVARKEKRMLTGSADHPTPASPGGNMRSRPAEIAGA